VDMVLARRQLADQVHQPEDGIEPEHEPRSPFAVAKRHECDHAAEQPIRSRPTRPPDTTGCLTRPAPTPRPGQTRECPG
jgi:hypothetical protein